MLENKSLQKKFKEEINVNYSKGNEQSKRSLFKHSINADFQS